jgi:hypothetical protein
VTIECPRCGTLYRRPRRAERGGDERYRCARCRHVFRTGGDEPAIVSGETEPQDEPRFTFDTETADEDGDEEEVAVPERRPARPPVAPTARFALRTMLFVTLAYAVVSVYLYTHPQAVGDALRGVPIIGGRLAEAHLEPAAIQLTNVHGLYQRVQGDRLVFVIAGTAINDSGVPVRSVQVEGRIAGTQEQRQVVFCGAAPRDVQDLSLREIALLQTLEPPKEWSLGPGEQASFLVVFPSPPTDLREFTAEVVAVQGLAHRTGAA